ncbi:MAG: ThiF family adenylyltransferase [Pseudomonadota bacterium]
MTDLLRDQPKRMVQERRLLEELAHAQSWFSIDGWGATEAGELCVNFRLKLLSATFDGVLIYPSHFPDVPAFARPRRRGESWSRHQYLGSGVLCLERGPDNWDPNVTGVDLIRSANLLLWNEMLRVVVPGTPAVPSRHATPPSQALRFERWRFVVTKGLLDEIEKVPTGQAVAIVTATILLGHHSVTMATAVGSTTRARIADVPEFGTCDMLERSGWFLPRGPSASLGDARDVATLRAALGADWPWSNELDEPVQMLVVRGDDGMRAFAMSGGAQPSFWECKVVDFSDTSQSRLPPAYDRLHGLTVGIVGLGSLGGKVAVSLARAGVLRFVLVDDDALAPQNLVRNELDWLSVGFEKVDATAHKIRLVAPNAEVLTVTVQVAGQENPQVAAMVTDRLAACDLVLDATADPAAFLALASVCKRSKVTMVWGEVFGGGIGALMARSRPGLDADPLSIRNHVLGVLSSLQPISDRKVGRYTLEDDGRVLVASDADVAALAASMTQFAVDALCAGPDSEYPVAAYLLGYKKAWEFKQPFDTIPIDCASAAQPAAPPASLTPDEEAAVRELVEAMEASRRAANNGTP